MSWILAGAIWILIGLGIARFASWKWHPDKGKGLKK